MLTAGTFTKKAQASPRLNETHSHLVDKRLSKSFSSMDVSGHSLNGDVSTNFLEKTERFWKRTANISFPVTILCVHSFWTTPNIFRISICYGNGASLEHGQTKNRTHQAQARSRATLFAGLPFLANSWPVKIRSYLQAYCRSRPGKSLKVIEFLFF